MNITFFLTYSVNSKVKSCYEELNNTFCFWESKIEKIVNLKRPKKVYNMSK